MERLSQLTGQFSINSTSSKKHTLTVTDSRDGNSRTNLTF